MNNEAYSFHKFEKNFLPMLLDIAREIILHDYIAFLDRSVIDDFIYSGQCDREIIENVESCLIMKFKNTCAGFSIVIENKIHLIMIDRKHQNKGHGTNLLKYMENKLFEKYNEIELQTFEKNSIANSFYRKNGWEKAEEINMDGMLLHKYKKWKISQAGETLVCE